MKKLALGVLGVACVAAWVASIATHRQLKQMTEENSRLSTDVQQLQALPSENAELKAHAVSTNELARLRNQESELTRLKAEQVRLQDQARKGSSSSTANGNTPSSSSGSDSSTPPNELKLKVSLPITDTLLAGGMESSPGHRTYMFVTPRFNDAATRVVFESVIVEAPEAVWQNLGLTLRPANERDQRSLTPETAQAFLKSLLENQNALIVARPKINAAEGADARMQMSNDLGVKCNLRMSYQISQDRKTLDLLLDNQITVHSTSQK